MLGRPLAAEMLLVLLLTPCGKMRLWSLLCCMRPLSRGLGHLQMPKLLCGCCMTGLAGQAKVGRLSGSAMRVASVVQLWHQAHMGLLAPWVPP